MSRSSLAIPEMYPGRDEPTALAVNRKQVVRNGGDSGRFFGHHGLRVSNVQVGTGRCDVALPPGRTGGVRPSPAAIGRRPAARVERELTWLDEHAEALAAALSEQ